MLRKSQATVGAMPIHGQPASVIKDIHKAKIFKREDLPQVQALPQATQLEVVQEQSEDESQVDSESSVDQVHWLLEGRARATAGHLF